MTQGRSDDGPNFEGHDERECGEHRTVGAHRAWCFDCSEWCYPGADGACKGCERPQLLARAVAAERGEDDQRAMLRDCRAELAAAQAKIAAVEALHQPDFEGERPRWKDSLPDDEVRERAKCLGCSNGITFTRWADCRTRAALAAASGVAPDKPAPTCEHGETRPHDTFTVHMWPPPVRPVTCPGPDDAPDHDHRKAWDAHVTASRQAGLCEYSGMTVQRCKDIDLCDCFDQPNGDDDAHS